MEEAPRIIIIPSAGVGHLTPLIEFAKTLAHRHGFRTTFLIPTDAPPSSPIRTLLSSLPPPITHRFLPQTILNNLPPTSGIETRISLGVTLSLPSISAALKSLSSPTPPSAFIVDIFGTDALQAAEELKIPRYVFFTSTAMALSLFLHLPTLDSTISGEYRHHPHPIQIPGCVPIHGIDLLDPLQNRSSEDYRWVLHNAAGYRSADGILINSFTELESKTFAYLLREKADHPRVHPVGPLVKREEEGVVSEIGRWLEEQPERSVVYVSFGSGGTLTEEQLRELGRGLEESGERFVWVVRRPPGKGVANAAYFDGGEEGGEEEGYLEEGFEERVKGRGLVVEGWAPQGEVLRHRSVGGFVTHCGWNSTLEAVVEGVPMVAWPLYAEQKMNAVMMVEEGGGLGVALRAVVGEGGVVRRGEVVRVVRELMRGEKGKLVRDKVLGFRDAAAAATADGGSSALSLAQLANKWKGVTNDG